MRYRVDLRNSYISYDEKDYEKAVALYKAEGIRLLRQKNIFDRGEVIEGLALGVEFEDQGLAN